jgi:hypothetical protein
MTIAISNGTGRRWHAFCFHCFPEDEESPMSAAATVARTQIAPGTANTRDVTLLELVSAISDVSRDDAEVVATILHLLRAGRVRLCGNFRGAPVEDLT